MPSHRSQSLGQREIARIDRRLASRPVLAPRLREHLRNRPVLMLARRLGLTDTTFRRRYPERSLNTEPFAPPREPT
ncbi:hypothetical protein OG830_03455 [Streptomyces sp. NBC_00121]|uniref:hypothetical protein n=1 Tax=unclassified Streptomyces TaxID=2593676 RepID=UPI002DDC75C9|nr:hypothetical protein [Streptomyces sp. NBC_01760]WSC67564.1 hypothetical protein OG807_03475 [Streptomyces sp. NBC_01760]WTI85452.1 hypothetical protein OHB17_04065 [Streptomyces sp. NBC_00724]